MAVRTYECQRKAGGCGQVFKDDRPAHAIHATMCPNCMMDGHETFFDEDAQATRYRVIQIYTPPNIISDIDNQDGRLGDAIEMPSLPPGKDGKPVVVKSRRELKEKLKEAREGYFKETDGEHTIKKQFRDEKSGKIVVDTVTTKTKGVDLGEIVPVTELGEGNRVESPFPGGKGKTLEQHESEIARRVGPPEHPGKG